MHRMRRKASDTVAHLNGLRFSLPSGEGQATKAKTTAIIVKIHRSHDGRRLIAVCDADILGKRFFEGNRQLDLTGSFYRGEPSSEQELRKRLSSGYMLNIVGKEAVAMFIRLGLVSKGAIITIAGIPHAQAAVD